ncbi:MAG: SMI1/KNR4 family protein [Gomphosphaeria aponina SAG 52.96 = DSM 107014]|uniref:SMI1/KNR4 family protein n=1 Tax=Gomphosphaeria aponina SAG 52.96 = DSM 107014 TaxID=1521640 RepID=A0A941GRR8_9CHRO|nr:SMI1/KNR4 family protein [Gomphosphaeria aponina SAG 52.96 = DSM 107014]
MYLEQIKQQLIALNQGNFADLNCCNLKEIIKLEKQLGIKLPSAYQEFLRIMGKGAGQHLFELQPAAVELLEENDFPQVLPQDAFVFLMHQGYQFSFFRLSEGENPPTYSYCEGETQQDFIKSHERFSEFLATEVELNEKYLNLKNLALLPKLSI